MPHRVSRPIDRLIPSFLALLAMIAGHQALVGEETKESTDGGDSMASGRLHFHDGNRLPGKLASADAETLTWTSPLFSEAPTVAYGAIDALLSNAPEFIPSPEDSVAITLIEGGRFYGDLVGFDENEVVIESRRCGTVRLKRESVASLRWLRQGDLAWRGPIGLCDTTYLAKPPPPKRWHALTNGAIKTVGWKQRIWIKKELPPLMEIDFKIRSGKRPEFEVQILKQLKNFNLRTWDDEIVIRRGSQHLSLLRLQEKDREVHLRLFWNSEEDSGLIADASGKILGQFRSETARAGQQTVEDGIPTVFFFKRTLDPEKSKDPESVTFNNFGLDLTLEELQVRRWDGSPPRPRLDPAREGIPRLELTDGSALGPFSGQPVRAEGDSVVFRSTEPGGETRRVPFSQLESIIFDLATRERPEATGSAPDRAEFADGTVIPGKMLGFDDQRLRFALPQSHEPVPIDVVGLTRIEFDGRPRIETEDPMTDKLVLDKETVSGRWHPSVGALPEWQLSGALESVPVTESQAIEIRRADPGEDDLIPRPAALLHLESGQVLSGDFAAIGPEGEWLELRSDLAERQRFEAGEIRAIQFTGVALETEGFKDRGWKPVRGKMGLNLDFAGEGKDEDRIDLKPGGAWGHGSILQGNELSFTLQANQWGALRVRMFGSSVDSPDSDTTRLLFAHFGNEIYCGFEQDPGDFARRQDIVADASTPVPVRLVWDAQTLTMFVKGQKAAALNFGENFPRRGHALVFEPANLWGNGEREMSVWNFSLKTLPGVVATPPVDGETRERALVIPRFRRDDLPRHALLSWTGDLLRGTITAATDRRISVRTGLESHGIDTERVAAAIWLKPPKSPEEAANEESRDDEQKKSVEGEAQAGQAVQAVQVEGGAVMIGGGNIVINGGGLGFGGGGTIEVSQAPPEPKATANAPGENHYTLQMRDGAHFSLSVDSFGPEVITGAADSLGKCRVPTRLVARILSGPDPGSTSTDLFAGWQLEHAPEPSPAEGGTGDSASPLIGKPAPEFELPLLGADPEKPFKLEKGKVVVLDFWATWCGPCVQALPEMLEAFAAFDPEEVAFIGVNQAEAPETISQFLKQRGWPAFPVLLDSRQDVGRAYGVEGIPHTVIIDREGKVSWVGTGFRPGGGEEAAELVRELLK